VNRKTGQAAAPSPDDLREAASEPLVREALDLFQGTLVNVERQSERKKDEK